MMLKVLWPRVEVRDLLLWQDVYMGPGAGPGGGGAVQEEGGSGQEEGSKENTPDVCPEFKRKSSQDSDGSGEPSPDQASGQFPSQAFSAGKMITNS